MSKEIIVLASSCEVVALYAGEKLIEPRIEHAPAAANTINKGAKIILDCAVIKVNLHLYLIRDKVCVFNF